MKKKAQCSNSLFKFFPTVLPSSHFSPLVLSPIYPTHFLPPCSKQKGSMERCGRLPPPLAGEGPLLVEQLAVLKWRLSAICWLVSGGCIKPANNLHHSFSGISLLMTISFLHFSSAHELPSASPTFLEIFVRTSGKTTNRYPEPMMQERWKNLMCCRYHLYHCN